jgi:hypothetical protein
MRMSRRAVIAGAIVSAASVMIPQTVRFAYADEAPKPAPPPSAADASPEAIVKNLYDRYLAGAYDYMDDGLRAHYFATATDHLLARVFDKSKTDNEPGIDYEPLIDGQDGEVKGLTIVMTSSTPATSTAPGKATVEARFTSYDDKMTVIFDFVTEKAVWKIDDIRNKEGNSLKAVAKDFLQ